MLFTTNSLFSESLIASVMPRERSLDIDDELTFKVCEAVFDRL